MKPRRPALSVRLPSILRVGRRTVGPDRRCFIIAEAGVNHDGRIELARRLIDAAATAGCDAVKFQIFEPELLVTSSAARAPYQRRNGRGPQREMLDRLALSAADLRAVVRHAKARGILFLATPFDEISLTQLVALGAPAIKLGSGEVTNFPLLRSAAATGQPILLSTGMSSLREVDAAVAELQRADAAAVMLFHCVTAYPAPVGSVNLRVIPALQRRFRIPVGFSDHTTGMSAALGAVALGASAIEKHLTLDRDLRGPDHRSSLEPAELAALVRQIRELESALGTAVKCCVAAERPNVLFARRSCVARVAIAKGERLTSDRIIAKRPAGGISPSEIDRLIGRRVVRDVPADTVLTWRHIAR